MLNHFSPFRLSIITLLVFGFFAFTGNTAFAQKKYKAMGVKCQSVTITDPGELYSTYEFSEEEAAEIKLKLGDKLYKDIIAKYNESAWPEKLGDFDTRIENEDKTKKYKVFLLHAFDGKNVLVVPAKLNKGMGEGYTSSSDFYIVIGDEGLKK